MVTGKGRQAEQALTDQVELHKMELATDLQRQSLARREAEVGMQ